MDNISVDVEKVIQKVYHTKELQGIINDILEDYIEQVVLMKDEELEEDRSEWIKVYGRENEEPLVYEYETSIHTLAIEIEQLRRYGKILYDEKSNESRLTETKTMRK